MKTFKQFLTESTDYEAFFKSKLDKYNVSSPEELSDEKKKEFFSEIENEWKGDLKESFDDSEETETEMDFAENLINIYGFKNTFKIYIEVLSNLSNLNSSNVMKMDKFNSILSEYNSLLEMIPKDIRIISKSEFAKEILKLTKAFNKYRGSNRQFHQSLQTFCNFTEGRYKMIGQKLFKITKFYNGLY